jgi:hypothetical protein
MKSLARRAVALALVLVLCGAIAALAAPALPGKT